MKGINEVVYVSLSDLIGDYISEDEPIESEHVTWGDANHTLVTPEKFAEHIVEGFDVARFEEQYGEFTLIDMET